MRQSVWVLSGLVVLLALPVVAAGAVQSEQLEEALDLFERQEYAAAQAVLAEVDREALSEEEQAEYDRLQQTLPVALAGIERATQDAVKGALAFEQGRWDEADARYRAVLENEFATAVLKANATIQRQRIEEKRRLAEAVAPTEVIPVEPETPPPPTKTPGVPPPQPKPTVEPPPPARLTPLDEIRLRDSLLWQRAVAQANELGLRAREAVANRDFIAARQLAEAALQRIEAARHYAEPVEKYLTAKEAAERLKREVERAHADHLRLQAERERAEVMERVEKRRELQERHRREKVEQLFNTAAQLRKQQRFAEAAEVLRQIRYIDPANVQARYQLEIVEDYASLHAQREWHHDVYTQTRTALTNAQEALIPWDYEVLYPKNWLELTARRAQAGLGIGDEASAELERRLDEILPEFEFHQAPLERVMQYLGEARDVNLTVDWEDLANNGIKPDKPVSLALRNLPFRTVLREVLAQAGGDAPLTFSVAEGLVRVATKDKLDRDKYVLVYDIRDLLINVARFPSAAHLDPAHSLYQNVAPDINPKGLFQSPGQPGARNNPEESDRRELIDKLISVIRQHIEPDSWQETGGGDASIRELNGQLVVYQTSRAHVEVRGLLDQLRARRALQIALEARFLDVTSNFLEEFGVDLDFVFNSASAGFDRGVSADGRPVVDPFSGSPVLVPRQFTRTGVTPLAPNYGQPIQQGALPIVQPYNQPGFVPYGTGVGPHFGSMTPISAQQSSLSLTDPSSINTTVPGSFAQRAALNPALNIVGSFLDNLQVDFLIRATQANARSAIVQAPRLVMENWSQTYIQVGRFRDYVASINPTVAEGAALPQPVVLQANSGVTLGVFGVISHDRRYVTVNVNATQAEEPQLERFEVQRASGNSPGVFITLRDQRFITVRTQVAIPDGGTVLLGGLKQVGEVEIEAGVPILSKVPVVKRFFSNRTIVKDTRTLLILMKVKIIIQSEAEEQAFPTFSSLAGG